MDHNQFLEAVRKHLELSPEDEILGVYIQVRRNQIVKIAGSNSVIIDGSGDTTFRRYTNTAGGGAGGAGAGGIVIIEY